MSSKVKNKSNNKKLTIKIKWYIIEHIENFYQILANLKKVEVIILREKPQFFGVNIKIIRYISNVDNNYLDIYKINKI